jgi:hypothetical protein
MRQRFRSHWLAAEELERAGLTFFHTIFQTRFHYKIKRKGGKFEKCKVRLVVRGDRMTKKDDSGFGDFEDAFSSVPDASGLRLLLAAIATQHNMDTDHIDIFQVFAQGELLQGDGQNDRFTSPPHLTTLRILSTSTSLRDLFTACLVPTVLGLRP